MLCWHTLCRGRLLHWTTLCTKSVKLQCAYASDQFCRPCVVTGSRGNRGFLGFDSKCWSLQCISEECQKPQPPLLLKKVSQYTSNLYYNTPPICITVLLVPLRSEERETLSVRLPFVSQYASHLYCDTPPICIAVLLGKSLSVAVQCDLRYCSCDTPCSATRFYDIWMANLRCDTRPPNFKGL